MDPRKPKEFLNLNFSLGPPQTRGGHPPARGPDHAFFSSLNSNVLLRSPNYLGTYPVQYAGQVANKNDKNAASGSRPAASFPSGQRQDASSQASPTSTIYANSTAESGIRHLAPQAPPIVRSNSPQRAPPIQFAAPPINQSAVPATRHPNRGAGNADANRWPSLQQAQLKANHMHHDGAGNSQVSSSAAEGLMTIQNHSQLQSQAAEAQRIQQLIQQQSRQAQMLQMPNLSVENQRQLQQYQFQQNQQQIDNYNQVMLKARQLYSEQVQKQINDSNQLVQESFLQQAHHMLKLNQDQEIQRQKALKKSLEKRENEDATLQPMAQNPSQHDQSNVGERSSSGGKALLHALKRPPAPNEDGSKKASQPEAPGAQSSSQKQSNADTAGDEGREKKLAGEAGHSKGVGQAGTPEKPFRRELADLNAVPPEAEEGEEELLPDLNAHVPVMREESEAKGDKSLSEVQELSEEGIANMGMASMESDKATPPFASHFVDGFESGPRDSSWIQNMASLKEAVLDVSSSMTHNVHAQYFLAIAMQREGNFQRAVEVYRNVLAMLKDSKFEESKKESMMKQSALQLKKCQMALGLDGMIVDDSLADEVEAKQNAAKKIKVEHTQDVSDAEGRESPSVAETGPEIGEPKLSAFEREMWKFLGEKLISEGRFEEAKNVFETLLSIAGKDLDSMNNLSVALLHLGDRESAGQYLNAILAEDPSNVAATSNLALLLLHRQQPSQTFKAEDGIKDERKTAIDILKSSTLSNPLQPHLWANLAAMKSVSGESKEALDCFKIAESLGAEDIAFQQLCNYSRILHLLHSPEARDEFPEWIKKAMAEVEGMCEAGVLPRQLTDMTAALLKFESTFEGKAEENGKSEEGAERGLTPAGMLLMAIKNSREDSNIFFQLGRMSMATEEMEFAIQMFHHAIERGGSSAHSWLNIGAARLVLEEDQTATVDFRQSLAFATSTNNESREASGGLNNLGCIYLRKRNLNKAENVFMAAVEPNPDFGPALNNLGLLRLMQGRHDEAVQFFARAAVGTPSVNINQVLTGLHSEEGGSTSDVETVPEKQDKEIDLMADEDLDSSPTEGGEAVPASVEA